MKNLTSLEFWKATSARAIWTFCEVFIGTVGASTLIEQVNWKVVLSTCLLATILSVAKSIVIGIPEVNG